jgi:hypothetical protein
MTTIPGQQNVKEKHIVVLTMTQLAQIALSFVSKISLLKL